jgi:hypothetical protein
MFAAPSARGTTDTSEPQERPTYRLHQLSSPDPTSDAKANDIEVKKISVGVCEIEAGA